jgi:hypothetical protein
VGDIPEEERRPGERLDKPREPPAIEKLDLEFDPNADYSNPDTEFSWFFGEHGGGMRIDFWQNPDIRPALRDLGFLYMYTERYLPRLNLLVRKFTDIFAPLLNGMLH